MFIQVGSWVRRESTSRLKETGVTKWYAVSRTYAFFGQPKQRKLLVKPEKKLKFSIVYGPRIFIARVYKSQLLVSNPSQMNPVHSP
jgi:hypothetical protein